MTCGGGESMRTRQCTNPSPEFGGKDCSSLGKSTEIMKCKNDPCPGNSLNFVAPNVVLHVLLQCTTRNTLRNGSEENLYRN